LNHNFILTSESVTEGHPDKVCDQISDAILDACLAQDPLSRVACETLAKNNQIVIAGEITTKASFSPEGIVKKALKEIGYEYSPEILNILSQQSPDIAQGVDTGGAGDQGMMFGYATNETAELMPLPILLAHKLANRLKEARKSGELKYLLPDGKSQITIEYRDGKPFRIRSVVIAAQHQEEVKLEDLRQDIIKQVIDPILSAYDLNKDQIQYFINQTGKFVLGGPLADAGLTGRKIIVDTYGGLTPHGGGAFSGKDPSKVDRSGAYMARYLAKNIVAGGLADKCGIQIAYVIGYRQPVSLMLDFYGTGKIEEGKVADYILKNIDLSPGGIIEKLNLRQPIYKQTAAYGHFGKEGLPWESTDLKDDIKSLL